MYRAVAQFFQVIPDAELRFRAAFGATSVENAYKNEDGERRSAYRHHVREQEIDGRPESRVSDYRRALFASVTCLTRSLR